MLKAQEHDEIPVLDIPQNEFTICPDESIIMDVSVSGIPPVFIEYTHNEETDTIHSPDENVMQIILADTGFYFINCYGDSSHTITSEKKIYVGRYPTVGLWFDGGGIFCTYQEPIPVTAHFVGVSPFTLIYLNSNNKDTLTTDQYTYTFSETDDFTIETSVLQDKNCTIETRQTASVFVLQLPQPSILGDTSVCLYKTSVYLSNQQEYTPQWEIPTGVSSKEGIVSTDSIVTINWIKPGNHTVNMKLTDIPSGCMSETATLKIEVLSQPPIRSSIDTIICFDFESAMHIELPTQQGDMVFWPELNVYGPSVDMYNVGTYSFIQTDKNTCVDTGYVYLSEVCLPEFHVPEAFTPNGDRVNDVLEIFGIFFNLKFTIYSPSGQELFYTKDKSVFWDGTRNGKDLPNGRYYWYADYTDKYGLPYSKSGYVMLIR